MNIKKIKDNQKKMEIMSGTFEDEYYERFGKNIENGLDIQSSIDDCWTYFTTIQEPK